LNRDSAPTLQPTCQDIYLSVRKYHRMFFSPQLKLNK